MSRVRVRGEDASSDSYDSSDSSGPSDGGRFSLMLVARHGGSDHQSSESGVPDRVASLRERIRRFYTDFHSYYYDAPNLTAARIKELNLLWTRNITDAAWAERQLRLFDEWATAEVAAEAEAFAESTSVVADRTHLHRGDPTDELVDVIPRPADEDIFLSDGPFSSVPKFEPGPLTDEELLSLNLFLASCAPVDEETSV